MAQCQQVLYCKVADKAINVVKLKKPHNECTSMLVVDYGQNMKIPFFNQEQPGTTYYYSPLNIYNLGVVDHAHVASSDYNNPKEHMHTHVYHEGVARKGANNVCSLILKTMKMNGMIHERLCGAKLNIVFDNCSGQNKNNTVLKLVPYLVEMGYLKKVNFIFLVVGHTKKRCWLPF